LAEFRQIYPFGSFMSLHRRWLPNFPQSCCYAAASLFIVAMVFLPVEAAISTAGNVQPTYPGGGLDPWSPMAQIIAGNISNGSISIDGGSNVSSTGGTIGSDPGVVGEVTVAGAGSTWVMSGQGLLLGVYGTGRLDVLAGAQVENMGASLGHIDGVGEAHVSGAGSQWLNSLDLIVGNGNAGELTIENQGLVRNRSAWIGLNEDAEGSVVVDGQQSTWEIGESLSLGDSSDSGVGTLSLTGAGSRVYVGAAAIAYGATLAPTQTSLIVSRSGGPAQLSIYAGNSIENAGSAYLGVGVGEAGSVLVDGAASEWNNAGNVFVGVDGTATLSLAGGASVSSSGTLSIAPGGTVTGDGTLSAIVSNAGIVAPGQAIGSLAVIGNYSQSASGKLQIELAGTLASEFDALNATGTALLGGMLEVQLGLSGGNPFDPQVDDAFPFLVATGGITGRFASVDLPNLAAGKMWHLRYAGTSAALVVTLAGDYNDDGRVDAADYTVWRDLLGSTFDPRADGDTNGVIDVADYNIWKANFGMSAGAGSLDFSPAIGVPEPTSLSLAALVLSLLVACQQRRRC
jgi:T5SS/PEP-CTERM-associated repeat protein